jgi:uncharacterized membrane protein
MKKQTGILLFGVILGLFGYVYFSFYVPYTRIQAKGMAVMVSGKDLKTAFSKNDIDLLSSKLKVFDDKYAKNLYKWKREDAKLNSKIKESDNIRKKF